MNRRNLGRRVAPKLERLEPRLALAAAPIITEFMASNSATLTDGLGDTPDWIEIFNAGDMPLDMAGWHLTDNPDNLDKYTFPSRILNAGEHLIVFASGRDVIDPANHLHTDFELSAAGEYLALVAPDRVTVVSQFGGADASFRPQYRDLSYGLLEIADDLTAEGVLTTPTPGAPNTGDIFGHGPVITDVTHSPAAPMPGEQVVVTARIAPALNAVASVQLEYRVMYIRPSTVSMFDDGMHGDGAAGDGVYGATIDTAPDQAGQMLRYKVITADADGLENSSPLSLSSPGGAQSPQYFGTVIVDPAVATSLPVFQWFTANEAASRTRGGTRASVAYAGEFYDNVFVRLRGGTSASLDKNSFKFDFNTGHNLRFLPDTGRVSEINLNTTFTDKAYVRQSLSLESYDASGTPGSEAVLTRVERNGGFFSVAVLVEQPNDELLEREGLDPAGALYKMFNTFTSATSGVEKKTRQYENNNDLASFISNINSLSGDALTNYILDNVNVPAVLNYLAATVITQNNDQQAKNYYLYRDSDGTGEWLVLPWDVDLTFGSHFMTRDSILDDTIWADRDRIVPPEAGAIISPSHPYVGRQANPGNRSWNRLIDALYESPVIREMYLRRLRTVMDELLQSPGTPVDELRFEVRLDELVDQLTPDVALDLQEWANPWSYGANLSLAQAIDALKTEYLQVRRLHLFETHLVGQRGGVGIPAEQIAHAAITFGTIEFDPASGNQDEEFIELVNANDFAVDISGWRLTGGVQHEFAPGTVIPAGATLYVSPDVNAFRARTTGPTGGEGRIVQGNYRGHISNAGETIRLLAADDEPIAQVMTPAMPSDVQRYLRITEVHYNPPGSDDTEFVELHNISDTLTLDLDNVRFTQGFAEDFNFTAGAVTSLAPGGYLLVVKDAAAFALAYPNVSPGIIAGQFSGSLDNGGETVKLEDADNGTVLEFRYEDGKDPGEEDWPVAADAGGFSLVIVDPHATVDAWEVGAGWRASAAIGGSPGQADGSPLPGDTNGDGRVDITDLNNVRNNFGAVGEAPLGDTNGDGVVNIEDLNNVRNNFGGMAGAAPAISRAAMRGLHVVPFSPYKRLSAPTSLGDANPNSAAAVDQIMQTPTLGLPRRLLAHTSRSIRADQRSDDLVSIASPAATDHDDVR